MSILQTNGTLGSDLTVVDGTWSLVSGRYRLTSVPNAPGGVIATGYAPLVDQRVKVKQAHTSSFADGGPVARWNGVKLDTNGGASGTGYTVDVFGGNSLNIFRWEAAAGDVQLTNDFITQIPEGDIWIEVTTISSTTVRIKAYYDGVLIRTFDDTSANRIQTAGRGGFHSFIQGTDGDADYFNLIVDNLGAPIQVETQASPFDATTPNDTPALTAKAGDVVIAFGHTQANDNQIAVPTNSGMTWTELDQVNEPTYGRLYAWKSVVDVDRSLVVSFVRSAGSLIFGGRAYLFRNANPTVGALVKAFVDAGLAQVAITPQQANSAIMVGTTDGDFSANQGAATWRIDGGLTFEEKTAFVNASLVARNGLHPNAGAIAAKTVGQLTPTSSHFSVIAVEIKEASSVPTLEQEGYRFRNDDGSEAAATWQAAQDTVVSLQPLGKTRPRFIVNATGDPVSGQFAVEYRKVGDAGWRTIQVI